MSLEKILTNGKNYLRKSSAILGMSLAMAFSPMITGCDDGPNNIQQECHDDSDCKENRICKYDSSIDSLSCQFPKLDESEEKELELCCGKIISISSVGNSTYGTYFLDLDNKVEGVFGENLIFNNLSMYGTRLIKSHDNSTLGFLIKEYGQGYNFMTTDTQGNVLNQHVINPYFNEDFNVYFEFDNYNGFSFANGTSNLLINVFGSSNTVASDFGGILSFDLVTGSFDFLIKSNDSSDEDFGNIYSFVVSPGNKVYFVSDHDETGDNSLYIMDTDGTNKQFIGNTEEFRKMLWVPGKGKIFGNKYGDSHYLIDPTTGNFSYVPRDGSSDQNLTISPDGEKYIYKDGKLLNGIDDVDDDSVSINDYIKENGFGCIGSACKLSNSKSAVWLP